MNPTQAQFEQLQLQVNKLASDLASLSQNFYKNNFSSSQVFNKDSTFASRLRVPIFSSFPSICEVGDIVCVDAKLYICTVANTTWTLVGSQT